MVEVDEFGREVPAIDRPLSASREGGRASGEGGGGASRGGDGDNANNSSNNYHHRQQRDTSSYHHHSHRGGDHRGGGRYPRGGRGGGEYYNRSSRNSPRHLRRRNSNDRHHHHHNRPPSQQQLQQNHISTQYVEEPLLCQFVWKDKQKKLQQQQQDDSGGGGEDSDDKKKATASTYEESAPSIPPPDGEEDQDEQDNSNKDDNDNDDTTQPTNTEEQEKDTTAQDDAAYAAYRQKYCLQFIRSFFNQHLDDSWFRAEYSALEKQRWLQLQHDRSAQEAAAFYQECLGEKFLKQASLDGGQKLLHQQVVPTSHLFSWQQANSQQAALLVTQIPPAVTDEQLVIALQDHVRLDDSKLPSDVDDLTVYSSTCTITTPTPSSSTNPGGGLQRHAVVIGQRAVVEDILKTIAASSSSPSSSSNKPAETSSAVPRHRKDHHDHHHHHDDHHHHDSNNTRAILSIQVDCTDPYGRLQYDADGRGKAPADGLAVPPQKARVWIQAVPTASPTAPNTSTNNITPCTVLSASLSATSRHATDAAAATKMARQLDAARDIPPDASWQAVAQHLFPDNNNDDTTNMLDVCIAYLRRVHLVSFYHNCPEPADSIAQVVASGGGGGGDHHHHHDAGAASSQQQHAAGTIRLRLANADELLQETATAAAAAAPTEDEPAAADSEEQAATPQQPVKDMLVQRLDESIQQALTNFEAWSGGSGDSANNDDGDGTTPTRDPHKLSPGQLEQASEIEAACEGVRDQWLRDHSVIDEDGRARCSFHFCHKLFKDTTFLHKHLLKKHVEYLAAEQAKCHDPYMMKAWDAATNRNLPEILVDCGSRFGLQPAAVTGQVPDTTDPEPALWKRQEEERQERQRAMQARREEVRQQQQEAAHRHHHHHHDSSVLPSRSNSNFVDVDDMQVEKVDVSFDNVAVPVPAATGAAGAKKKKKKKRKLL